MKGLRRRSVASGQQTYFISRAKHIFATERENEPELIHNYDPYSKSFIGVEEQQAVQQVLDEGPSNRVREVNHIS